MVEADRANFEDEAMAHGTEPSDHQETAAEIFDRLSFPTMAGPWGGEVADAAQRRQGDLATQEDPWGTS